MSFVYAQKDGPCTMIYSDTKVTFDSRSRLNWGEQTRLAMERYGIVKSIIVRNDCCISFAGNDIRRANELFRELDTHENFSEEQIIDLALRIHMAAPENDIEFIICTADKNDETSITCIKNRNITRGNSIAWIGSEMTFLKMQEIRFNENRSGTAFIDNDRLFWRAVMESQDNTVGGFEINTIYTPYEHGFFYTDKVQMEMERAQTVQSGGVIRFNGSAEEGAFTIHQYWSNEEVRLDIEQADLSILYTRKRLEKCVEENLTTSYFLLPIPYRTSTKTVLTMGKDLTLE